MVENPNEDTEPHVQRLFVGSYRETGMWSSDLLARGLVSKPYTSYLPASFYFMKIFKIVLGVIFLISFLFQIINLSQPTSGTNEEYAIRNGTSIAVSGVIGALLLYSAFKKKKEEVTTK